MMRRPITNAELQEIIDRPAPHGNYQRQMIGDLAAEVLSLRAKIEHAGKVRGPILSDRPTRKKHPHDGFDMLFGLILIAGYTALISTAAFLTWLIDVLW